MTLLGRGAMGEVYRADDLRIGRPIALKLLAVSAERRPHVERFVAEVRLARDIAHPNVCRVYDIGSGDGWHYLTMEYVDGETLASLLRRVGRVPFEKATDIARQLCAGLASAHDAGVLHRDIKPSNIMIDGRGHVRLMDFGLAITASDATPGQIVGTPAYMAPEQIIGQSATERTDLFALGLVLYEIFTGRRIFDSESLADRRRLEHQAPQELSLDRLDSRLGALIHACLMRDPAARPESARAVAQLLPGEGQLAAAVAEGRLLAPDMVAAAGARGELRQMHAWGLFGVVAVGVLLVAAQSGSATQLRPEGLPKSPDALVERAREVLKLAGQELDRADSEHWFIADVESEQPPPATNARLRRIEFAFRQSPSYLLPQNLFRLVTDEDPSPTVAGMASVNLDADGRLIEFSLVPTTNTGSGTATADWNAFFGAAGLSADKFVTAADATLPAVPCDAQLAWTARSDTAAAARVSAASLRGHPVYFAVTPRRGISRQGRRSPVSPGATPVVEAAIWFGILLAFGAAAVIAQRNYRRGDGDRRGARRWCTVLVIGGTVSAILQAHHVPSGIEEAMFLFGAIGWALVFGALTWLLYLSLEPFVRRFWPTILVSWVRLLSGRGRDPLVGRDVLIGLAVGIALTYGQLLVGKPAPNELLIQQLDALRSTRAFGSDLLFHGMNAVQYQLGALFFLVLIRLVVRRTWIAVIVTPIVFLPLTIGGTALQPAALVYALVKVVVALAVLIRIGLVAASSSLLCEFLLLRLPVTLDTNAWYFGYSVVTLLTVLSLAVIAAIVASTSHPPLAHPFERAPSVLPPA